jgi:WhiB family redox-sensing transcriptional regulator
VSSIAWPATTWASQAACAGQGPDVFFDDAPAVVAQAKALCLTCPVRQCCLDLALACPSLQGVWGGLTEEERSMLRGRF